MALKPVPPRDDSDRERARYQVDLADIKANPSAWANGPEHVPVTTVQETVTTRLVERPPGTVPVAPQVEEPVKPLVTPWRQVPPSPGVALDESGRLVPV